MDKFRVRNTGIGVFDLIVRILIVLLPFTTILSVFTEYKLGIPGFTYYKEIFLIWGLLYLTWKHIKKELTIRWGWIDVIILIYIAYLILISFWTTGIRGIVYGWRYDFEFLVMFWVMYHWSEFLEKPLSYYLKLFLISCGSMLLISGLLKFPFSEDLLLYVGYSGNPSAWQFWSAPPIFQGIDGANVRRFQGILDGPNTMGAFLLLFSGVFAYYFRSKKEWFFVNGIILIGLFIMITYTGSRSAILGFLIGLALVIAVNIRTLYQKYRTQMVAMLLVFLVLIGGLYIMYAGRINAIIGRAGSTSWHIDRVVTSIHRFAEHPLGQWLGSSGPGYRYTQQLEGLSRAEIEKKDAFYIPESWYLQQLVEGGVIGGFAFLLIMITIFWNLFKKNSILGATFVGIGVMNSFLHTFESAPLSLLLFLLIGILLSKTHVHER